MKKRLARSNVFGVKRLVWTRLPGQKRHDLGNSLSRQTPPDGPAVSQPTAQEALMFTIKEVCDILNRGQYVAFMNCDLQARHSSVVVARTSDGIRYFPFVDTPSWSLTGMSGKSPGRVVVVTLRALLVGEKLLICDSMTVRRALANGYGPAPEGATHSILLSSGVRLWERTAWRKTQYWYRDQWLTRDLLQVARRMEFE
jgi:hypothetical protein